MLDNAGLMISCGSCGFMRHIPLTGTSEEIEAKINDTIQEGWRYTKKWGGYICPKCIKGGVDPLYEAFAGKVRTLSKTDSYKELLLDSVAQIRKFQTIERRV